MRKGFIASILIFFTCGLTVALSYEIGGHNWQPDYPIQDIISILNKKVLTSEDYQALLYQTGLGKPAIDSFMVESEGKQTILKFQRKFFNPPKVSIDMLNPITIEKVYADESNNRISGFEIAPIKNGDILITNSTGTLGVNHGHSAIVVDASKGTTLEAFTIGQVSELQNVNSWERYSSFILLRPKDTPEETLNLIAQFACENLVSRKYHLLAGLKTKLVPLDKMVGTHCSHIVWYPYMQFGYDIDSNKGRIVTPKDIANSPLLEVVQVYGIDPVKLWE